jgi:hypothetical protein
MRGEMLPKGVASGTAIQKYLRAGFRTDFNTRSVATISNGGGSRFCKGTARTPKFNQHRELPKDSFELV